MNIEHSFVYGHSFVGPYAKEGKDSEKRKEKTARKGQRGKDSEKRTTRKGRKGQRGKEGKDSEERTARKGRRGKDSEERKERTARKGQRYMMIYDDFYSLDGIPLLDDIDGTPFNFLDPPPVPHNHLYNQA